MCVGTLQENGKPHKYSEIQLKQVFKVLKIWKEKEIFPASLLDAIEEAAKVRRA